VESFLVGHLVNGLVHCLDNGWGQRLGDIANAHPDDLLLGVGYLEGVDLFRDVGE